MKTPLSGRTAPSTTMCGPVWSVAHARWIVPRTSGSTLRSPVSNATVPARFPGTRRRTRQPDRQTPRCVGAWAWSACPVPKDRNRKPHASQRSWLVRGRRVPGGTLDVLFSYNRVTGLFRASLSRWSYICVAMRRGQRPAASGSGHVLVIVR